MARSLPIKFIVVIFSILLVSCSAIVNTQQPTQKQRQLFVTYKDFNKPDSACDHAEKWSRLDVMNGYYCQLKYSYEPRPNDSDYLYISELIVLCGDKAIAEASFRGMDKAATAAEKKDTILTYELSKDLKKIGDTSVLEFIHHKDSPAGVQFRCLNNKAAIYLQIMGRRCDSAADWEAFILPKITKLNDYIAAAAHK